MTSLAARSLLLTDTTPSSIARSPGDWVYRTSQKFLRLKRENPERDRHNRLIVAAAVSLFLLHIHVPLDLVVVLFKLVINKLFADDYIPGTVCLEENTITFTDKSSSLKLWKDLEILGDILRNQRKIHGYIFQMQKGTKKGALLSCMECHGRFRYLETFHL